MTPPNSEIARPCKLVCQHAPSSMASADAGRSSPEGSSCLRRCLSRVLCQRPGLQHCTSMLQTLHLHTHMLLANAHLTTIVTQMHCPLALHHEAHDMWIVDSSRSLGALH